MVIGILVILTIILLLVMIGAIWGINVAMARMVGDKHRDLEEITATGQVPASWGRRYEKRLARLRQDPVSSVALAALQARALADYLRRLDKLTQYAKTTSLVSDEETRQTLLDKLAAARSNWCAAASIPEPEPARVPGAKRS